MSDEIPKEVEQAVLRYAYACLGKSARSEWRDVNAAIATALREAREEGHESGHEEQRRAAAEWVEERFGPTNRQDFEFNCPEQVPSPQREPEPCLCAFAAGMSAADSMRPGPPHDQRCARFVPAEPQGTP